MSASKRSDLLRQYDLIIKALCGIYGLCLLKVLLFKYTSPLKMFSATEGLKRSMNLIPLRSLVTAIFSSDASLWGFIATLLANVLIFVPLGIFICLHVRKKKWLTVGFPVILGVSFAINLLRFLCKIGMFNIDDILQNVIGGLLGVYLFQVIVDNFRTSLKVRLASICTVAGLGVLGLLFMLTGISDAMTYSLFHVAQETPPGGGQQPESEYYINTDEAGILGYYLSYEDGWIAIKNISESVPSLENPAVTEQKGDAWYYQYDTMGAKVPEGTPVVLKTVDMTSGSVVVTYEPYSLDMVSAMYAGYTTDQMIERYADLAAFRATGEEPPIISFSMKNDEDDSLIAYDICVTVVKRGQPE